MYWKNGKRYNLYRGISACFYFPNRKTMRKTHFLKYCFTIFLLFNFIDTKAQIAESMMPDVSYPFLQKLIDTAKKYYPRVQILEHKTNMAVENVKKAKLSWLDLFTFSYLYSPNNSSTLVNPSILNGYQFGVYLNFAAPFIKPHNVKYAKQELAITKLEKEEYLLTIEAEVKLRYFKYIAAKAVLKARNQAAIDAENAVTMLRHRYEKSEDTFENYSRYLELYNERKYNVIEAESFALTTKSSLEEMVCKKIEDIK